MEQENKHSESLKVLSDTQMIVRNSIGIRKVLNRKSFRGYLKEKGHQGKTIEQDKIVVLLQECANSRDQVLLLLLAETGFRIGELLGVRYAEDIDYEKHIIYVNFRDDNENGARAKNAELRRAKISDATFDILMFYIEDYKELIIGQEYLFINVSGDYVGKYWIETEYGELLLEIRESQVSDEALKGNIKRFLIRQGIHHIKEIDYTVRSRYEAERYKI